MTVQKPCKYQEYPKSVTGEGGAKIVNSAEEEAEVTGKPLTDVLEQNEANALTPAEKLKKADEILAEAQRIRAETQSQADKQADAPEEASQANSEQDKPEEATGTDAPAEENAGNGETQPAPITCADDVPAGDKDALETYAKEKFGIDIDKRKKFEDLLELVKQEEAKTA